MKKFKWLRVIKIVVVILVIVFITRNLASESHDRVVDYHASGEKYNEVFTNFNGKVYALIPSADYFEVENADPKTFRQFDDHSNNRELAIDKNHVFSGNLILPELNPETAYSLKNGYITDGTTTYFCSSNSERNCELRVLRELYPILLKGFGLDKNSKKPQTYIYPFVKLPNNNGGFSTLFDNVATNGKEVFYQGKILPKANPASIHRILENQEFSRRENDFYFSDGEHIYFKDKLLDLISDTAIYALKSNIQNKNFLYSPNNGMLYVDDYAFDEAKKPYTIIGSEEEHLDHILIGSKDGIYFYNNVDEKQERAGENPFYGENYKALSEFVFTNGKKTLFLTNGKLLKKNKSIGVIPLSSSVEELSNVESSKWQKIGDIGSYGSVWENSGNYFYFDELGTGQLMNESIYKIEDQTTALSLLSSNIRIDDIRDLVTQGKLKNVNSKILVSATTNYKSIGYIVKYILFSIVILVIFLEFISKIFKIRMLPAFKIKNGKINIKSIFGGKIELSKIDHVVFSTIPTRNTRMGRFKIIYKNGDFSLDYGFSSSIFFSSLNDLEEYIGELQEKLEEVGIANTYVK